MPSTKLAVKLLFKVVVPVPAPTAMVVAAPPMFRVVTPELSKLKVPAVEVRSPPLTATSAAAVTFPVRVEVPSMVRVPLA